MKNEEVLHRVTEERQILHTTIRKKANGIGHVLHWNLHPKHVVEGKIEGIIVGKTRKKSSTATG
jgi:hypothetical protein